MPFKSNKQRKFYFGARPKNEPKQSRHSEPAKRSVKQKSNQSMWTPKPKEKPKIVPIYNYRVVKTEVKTVAHKPSKEQAQIMATRLSESTGVKHKVVAEKTDKTKVVRPIRV